MMMINRTEEQLPYSAFAYINLIKDFRFLMTQLAYLTREYFVAVFSGYGNADAIANRLYQLPAIFKGKYELVFGTPLSEEFLNLLFFHVASIQSLANALIIGDQAAADYSTRQLYKNAEDIAAHYGKINPFWDEAQWKTLLSNYVRMLIEDAVILGTRDFERDLDIFDRMLLSALLMGDYLADGFVQYITATKGGV